MKINKLFFLFFLFMKGYLYSLLAIFFIVFASFVLHDFMANGLDIFKSGLDPKIFNKENYISFSKLIIFLSFSVTFIIFFSVLFLEFKKIKPKINENFLSNRIVENQAKEDKIERALRGSNRKD